MIAFMIAVVAVIATAQCPEFVAGLLLGSLAMYIAHGTFTGEAFVTKDKNTPHASKDVPTSTKKEAKVATEASLEEEKKDEEDKTRVVKKSTSTPEKKVPCTLRGDSIFHNEKNLSYAEKLAKVKAYWGVTGSESEPEDGEIL